ncbi:MAG TPA: ABC transporter permease [Thermoplasmata archaeon]|nr:ABC transporter permease [Thermoplasmata archaeon]
MYRALAALVRREMIRWFRSPVTIISSIIFPFMYLALFGQALNLGKFVGRGGPITAQAAFLGAPNYYSYFSVGMVGFVALTGSLFLGAQVIFDKRLGYVKKAAVAPIPRMSIFGGRVIAGAIRPILFSGLVIGIALLFAHINGLNGLTVSGSLTVLGVGEVAVALLLISIAFSALFLAVGFVLNSPEAYFGIVNIFNLPLLFTSSALYPTTIMPAWLQSVSSLNPVSMAIDVMRENLFSSAAYYPHPPEFYLGELALFALVISALAFWVARRGLTAR